MRDLLGEVFTGTTLTFILVLILLTIAPVTVVENKHLVKNGYAVYNENKELVIKDEFKKYYMEVKE